MNDKSLMENVLLLEKGVCDLYMHGAIESSSLNVHEVFKSALNESDRKSTRLNSSHRSLSRMPSSA